MNIDISLRKAHSLINVNREKEAIQELEQVLLQEPENLDALLLMISCYHNLQEYDKSLNYCNKLLGIAPDLSVGHYYQAANLLHLNKYKEAESHIREAISIEPDEAEYFGLLSLLLIQTKQWEKALEAANQGLAFDPDNPTCMNCRTQCLTHLGKKDELKTSIEEILSKMPENSYSHATAGWAKLNKREYKEAKEHFAEALRLQPNNAWARQGMIEALKAKNLLYSAFLSFFLWVAKFQAQAQWAIVIGIYLGSTILRRLSKEFPFLIPVAILLSILIYMTWIIDSLFNLLLRLDKQGKYMLNEREIQGSNWVGSLLAITFLMLGLGYFVDSAAYLGAVFAGTMVIPISTYFGYEAKKVPKAIGYYTIGLGVLGILGLANFFFGSGETAMTLGGFYLLGIWTFGWVANYFAIRG